VDPALWELLRAEAGADGDRVLEAIIRLARPGIEIPDLQIVSRFGTIATCRIRARDIIPVRARRDVVSLKAAHGLSPGFELAVGAAVPDARARADFRPTDVRRSPGLTLTGKGVVVACADWGVDVDSAAFRWPTGPAAAGGDRPAGGTRFLSFWDQRDLAAGPPPDPYGYGTVHDREQIDRALHGPRPYERLGYHPAIADRRGHGTHGTHVLDIAAGNGQAGGPAGIAPEADLIFVDLADRTTGGLANLGDSVRLLEAVDFISRTAGSQPCVINISAGRVLGPKDGTTLVERALDELLAATPGRFVVNSAGNYFGWRTHSCGRIAPGESRSLTFVIDPADITLNELEIWYDGGDEFAVRIDPPGYTGGRVVRLGERSDLLIEGRTVGRVYHRKQDPNNGDNHIVAYIDPIGPAGNWTVTLEARQVNNGRFHAWIERDDTCRSCQARFTPADSNPVTTIGTITTSRLPLIVGAYDGHDPARPVAPFSSSGPSRDLRPKPDLVAPGVDVLAARSASIIDSHNPGLLVRKSGTSMATPHVTGAVALCLEAAGNTLSARQIRSLVLGSCDPPRNPDAPYRLGRGYLNIPRLIADLRRTLTAPSAKEPTMNPDDSIVLLAAAPATAYREYLYRPHSQLARWIDDRFDVVAGPGQRLDQPPQLGDVLLEITLGRAKSGRCLVLKAHDPELEVSPRRLSAGQLLLRPRKPAEMSEPLAVEPTAETEGSNPAVDVAAELIESQRASVIDTIGQPVGGIDVQIPQNYGWRVLTDASADVPSASLEHTVKHELELEADTEAFVEPAHVQRSEEEPDSGEAEDFFQDDLEDELPQSADQSVNVEAEELFEAEEFARHALYELGSDEADQLEMGLAAQESLAAETSSRPPILTSSQLRRAWRAYECAEHRMVDLRLFGKWDTPVNPATVDAWRALERALAAAGYDVHRAWVYNCREIGGKQTRSLHAYGLAIDIDHKHPRCNPNRATPDGRKVRFSSAATKEARCRAVQEGKADTSFTSDQVAAVEAIRTIDGHQVFAWGGRWRTTKDTMHFQINVTPDELARGLQPDSVSHLQLADAAEELEDDEPNTLKAFTPPTIPDFTGNAAFSTAITWGDRFVEVHYFPGISGQTVLILGGVHQDERKAIVLSNEVLKRLQSSRDKPFYNVVFIPNLFGGRNTTDQKIDKTPTNRNFPGQKESLADSARRGKGVPRDVKERKILPENVILLALIEKVKPKDSLSIHGHSVVEDPKEIKKKGAASVTVDPKPGGEDEADLLTTEMALAASKAGVPVPGNFVKNDTARTRYPTETAAHEPGVTFGQWGSHQGGMNQYLIETEGKPWPRKPSTSQQAEISGWAQIILSKFLANPLEVAAAAIARLGVKLWEARRVLLGN
jgi:subtilisin family serine protease